MGRTSGSRGARASRTKGKGMGLGWERGDGRRRGMRKDSWKDSVSARSSGNVNRFHGGGVLTDEGVWKGSWGVQNRRRAACYGGKTPLKPRIWAVFASRAEADAGLVLKEAIEASARFLQGGGQHARAKSERL